MKKIIQLSAFSILVAACSQKAENKKADVSFAMKTIRVESTGGCKSDTLQCASYEVQYPEFSGLDSAVVRILSRHMDASVSMGSPVTEGQTMKEIGEGFVQEYEDFRKEAPEEAAGWYYNGAIKVETLTDTLLSLSIQEEYFTGGAHGGSGMSFISISPQTGGAFTLDNFLKSGYQEPLRAIGDEVFRRVREIPDTASLNENYFEFPDDKFELNQNYGFTKEGIVFYFVSYEIAPYAAGPTEVIIPYDRIKEWIK